jgi:hypothetical protein
MFWAVITLSMFPAGIQYSFAKEKFPNDNPAPFRRKTSKINVIHNLTFFITWPYHLAIFIIPFACRLLFVELPLFIASKFQFFVELPMTDAKGEREKAKEKIEKEIKSDFEREFSNKVEDQLRREGFEL